MQRALSVAPVVQHPRVQEILVDDGQLVPEQLVQAGEHFGGNLHDASLELALQVVLQAHLLDLAQLLFQPVRVVFLSIF